MSNAPAPCRLSVFLALEAPSAVILRRGPSEWAQLIRWDRTTDTFEPGQWFHGRAYERRCDVSPDGRLFIYFASKQAPRQDEDDVGAAWTAISRPPYFTALALWRNLGTWYGGGVFKTNRDVLLDVTCRLDPHEKFRPRGLRFDRCPADSAPWEQRLLLHGWQMEERGFHPRTHMRVGRREIWWKRDRTGRVKLVREIGDVDFRRFGGPYVDGYWLETGDDIVPLSGATWADWEDGERLVLVRDGKILEGRWDGSKLSERDLFDASPLKPVQVAPPDWAQRW
jgi:hypothetical protein